MSLAVVHGSYFPDTERHECRHCGQEIEPHQRVVYQRLPREDSRAGTGREWMAHVKCLRELVDFSPDDDIDEIRDRILTTGKVFP